MSNHIDMNETAINGIILTYIFKHYFAHLLDGYPTVVIVLALAYTMSALAWGMAKSWRQAWALLAFGYIALLLYVTVFSRPSNSEMTYSLLPFSSYLQIANGDDYLLPQVIMNVVVFVPVGFLSRAAFKEWSWGKAIGYGSMFSIVVEMLQLVLMKGTAEIDDVFHNTLGCVIGIAAYELLCSCKSLTKTIL